MAGHLQQASPRACDLPLCQLEKVTAATPCLQSSLWLRGVNKHPLTLGELGKGSLLLIHQMFIEHLLCGIKARPALGTGRTVGRGTLSGRLPFTRSRAMYISFTIKCSPQLYEGCIITPFYG